MILYNIRNENLLAGCVADGADFSCEFRCNLFIFNFSMAFTKSSLIHVCAHFRMVMSFGLQKSNWLLRE
ncbi:hypothetical protein RIF29_11598 [Crotalaria pallida]|uniref:Uncharacterized protein n=1 Tax=Crotalaria pallida TaxID=3830 RepID=A0AAN9IMA5_CROPI